MNTSIYIFGSFGAGYTQYPDEADAAAVFRRMADRAKAATQIGVHRDGSLMYHVYLRRLADGQFLGLCAVLNGLRLTRFDHLFSAFETIVERLAAQGILISYDKLGNLSPTCARLSEKAEDVETAAEWLREAFDTLQADCTQLPPDDYSVAIDSEQEFNFDADADWRDMASHAYACAYSYIYKDEGYETGQMSSYRAVLAALSDENRGLKAQCQRLTEENRRVKRQKRQFRGIVILLGILLVLSAFFLQQKFHLAITEHELNRTRDHLDRANSEMTHRQSEIDRLSHDVRKLRETNRNMGHKLEDARHQIDAMADTIMQQRDSLAQQHDSLTRIQPTNNSSDSELLDVNPEFF